MRIIEDGINPQSWDDFVAAQPQATVFHRFGWASALAEGAGHRPYFLCAEESGEIVGVLPLCLMESRLFGRFLVSLPHYLGSVCAVNREAADALLQRACALAKELRADSLELRGNEPLAAAQECGLLLDTHKASFLLDLTAGETAIWKNLRKQTRNRIRKGQRAQLQFESGQHLLDEFWRIFSINTRAIGSPTFDRKFFAAVISAFGSDAQFLVARQAGRAVAAKLVLRFRDTLTMLWGGTIPREKSEGANYFLTWETLHYAICSGCRVLDMGRSTVGSGPYQFKAHWGGRELRHHWYLLQAAGGSAELRAENPRFRLIRQVWRKLPLPVTRWLGPWVARQIP